MPWDRTQPSNPKYKTREHRITRAKYEREMATRGYLWCAQPICLMPSRYINKGERWHLLHDDTGTTYLGPGHAQCNVVDGAKRGRAKQSAPPNWDL